MLRAGYCALQSRAAQTEHIKHLAREFQHLSEKDSLQPQLVLPNSVLIPVCQNAFCIVYGMGQGGLTLTTLKTYLKERFAPEVIKHSDQNAFIALDQSSLEPGIPVHHPPKKMFDRKCINFSMGEENPGFTKNANLILTQLFFMVWAMLTSSFAASRSRVLRIHLDNPTSENKHQFLFALGGWYLWKRWFAKVLFTFLPVGHTSNEVDSSVFRTEKCEDMDITCLPDVFEAARRALPPPNQLIYLKSVLDFRSWLQPHLIGVQNTMKGRFFEMKLSDSVRPDGSHFSILSAKQYLNDIATFGEWAPVMEGMPQGLPKPAAPTREVLRDKVVTTLKKLLKHPMLIHGADRKDWAGQLLVNGRALNLRVLEAESLPPLDMIRSANLRCTVADEQLKAMIAANDDGRVHLKIVPSAAKRFDNIQKLEHEDVIVEEISEDNSAAAAGKGPLGALPVCPTLRESQLEGSFKGLHDSFIALSKKHEDLRKEFEARVELDNQEIEVVKQKYHKLKKAVLATTSSAQTKHFTDRNSAAPESSAVPTSA
eukprot:g15378.t1